MRARKRQSRNIEIKGSERDKKGSGWRSGGGRGGGAEGGCSAGERGEPGQGEIETGLLILE